MLKKFFIVVCGSFVGVWLALLVFSIISIIASFAIFGSMASLSSSTKKVSSNSILYVSLSGDMPERQASINSDLISQLKGGTPPTSLSTMVNAIRKAATNDKIKGMYIDCNGLDAAPATRQRLRRAIKEFKGSGKFIYAYGNEGITQGDYYIASVADSIFLNPVGMVDIHGMASVTQFYRKTLEKIGVKMQVIRVGQFKSAVEPYLLDSISPANRLQQQVYMGAIWKDIVDSISASRKIAPEHINQLADSIIATMPAETLVKEHIVDGICYRTDFENKLKALTDVDDDDDLNIVYPEDLGSDGYSDYGESSGSNKIALVYATGEIDGASRTPWSGSNGIDSEEIIETLNDISKDKDIVGVVIRVNSPGGSAFGSEQIWKAVQDLKAKANVPVVISMGDYAASGGYYISCGADQIFAEPTTITGSIGIFGVIPSFQGLVEDKIGIGQSIVKTNANADFGTMTKDLSPIQQAAMQQYVNRGYELFTKRCADGRKVSQDSIKAIAQGRVWDAKSAKAIGLVDSFGGIEEAIKAVAAKAHSKSYQVSEYPKVKDNWQTMLQQLGGGYYEAKMKKQMGMFYTSYAEVQQIMNRKHLLCLMPEFEIK